MDYILPLFLKNYSRYLKLRASLPSSEKEWLSRFDLRKRAFYSNLWHETAKNVHANIQDMGYDYYLLMRGDQRTFVRFSEVMLDNHLTLTIAGNKPLTHRLLKSIPGYPGLSFTEFTLQEINKAFLFMKGSKRPVVIKPAKGTGGGHGVTLGIRTRQQLVRAAVLASMHSINLVIEEEIDGSAYRLLFLNGQYLHAVRRDPPQVIGDGKSTIKELIASENERRLNGERITALKPLLIDLDCLITLQSQGMSPRSVPKEGQAVRAKNVSNQNNASENHDVTDQVHPHTVSLCGQVVAQLGCELGGVDILTSDIGKPLQATGGIISEVNTTPGLHHHYLLPHGQDSIRVCDVIIDYILSRSKCNPIGAPLSGKVGSGAYKYE